MFNQLMEDLLFALFLEGFDQSYPVLLTTQGGVTGVV